jgi:hypothetical protein
MSSRKKRNPNPSNWDTLVTQRDQCLASLQPLRGHTEFARAFGHTMSDSIRAEMTHLLTSIAVDAKDIYADIEAVACEHRNKNGEFFTGKVPETDNAQFKYLELNSRYIDIAQREETLLGSPMETLANIRDSLLTVDKEEEAA